MSDDSLLISVGLFLLPILVYDHVKISFYKILKNKSYHAKVLLKRFDLNGHTIGFRPQTQKLELHYMSP